MSIPYQLILFRLLLAPAILGVAYFMKEHGSLIILVLMFFGLLSDIFDGIIARKMNISTEKMRRLDSQIDVVFWLSISFSCYIIHPELIMEYIIGVAALLIMETCCYAVSLMKFGKETCTHAFVSKLWGLMLLATFTSLLGFSYGGYMLAVCIVLGLASQLDVIMIILILPKWTHDVPSFYHALLIRQGKSFKKSKYLNS